MHRLSIVTVAVCSFMVVSCSPDADPGPTRTQRTAVRSLLALTPTVDAASGASTTYLRECVGNGPPPSRCVVEATAVLQRDARASAEIARHTSALARVTKGDDRWRDCLTDARAVPPAFAEFDGRLTAYRDLLVRRGSDSGLGPALVRANDRPYRLWQIADARCTKAVG